MQLSLLEQIGIGSQGKDEVKSDDEMHDGTLLRHLLLQGLIEILLIVEQVDEELQDSSKVL